MADPIVSPPTLDGFIAWARAVMGIPTVAMPDNDPGWNYAFTVAVDLVPTDFANTLKDIYTLTVYNYAGSQLLQFQQDISGQTFFADARKAYGINNFIAGVITSASDVSTNETLAVGHGLQDLGLLDLQRIKDPYGRQAVAFMQTLGTLWGLT
jgi:hypothetical protein